MHCRFSIQTIQGGKKTYMIQSDDIVIPLRLSSPECANACRRLWMCKEKKKCEQKINEINK